MINKGCLLPADTAESYNSPIPPIPPFPMLPNALLLLH